MTTLTRRTTVKSAAAAIAAHTLPTAASASSAPERDPDRALVVAAIDRINTNPGRPDTAERLLTLMALLGVCLQTDTALARVNAPPGMMIDDALKAALLVETRDA